MKYKNTVVLEFDDLEDERRKQVSELLIKGFSEGWVTYFSISDDVDRSEFEDKDNEDE